MLKKLSTFTPINNKKDLGAERNRLLVWGSNPLNIIFTTALTLVVLIAFGIVGREAAFIFLLLYIFFVLFYPVERGVELFLRSIPFFIALPITESFDNFNIWRIILLLIFVKWFFVEYDWRKWLKSDFNRSKIKQFIKENKIEFAGFLFLLFAGLSVFVGPDTIAGAKRFIFILNAVMLFVVVRAMIIKNKKNALSFAKNFAYSGILAVLFGYLQFISAYFVPAWVFHYWWGQIVSVGLYGAAWGDIVTNFGNTWFSYSGDTLRLRMFSTFPDSHSFPMYVIMTFPALFMVFFGLFTGSFRKASFFGLRPDFSSENPPLRSQQKTSDVGQAFLLPRASQNELSKNSHATDNSWLHLHGSVVRKLFLLIAFAFINLALILSGTRGIWLASIATLFVVFLFKFLKIDKKFNKILLTSLLIFLIMFPVYFGIVSFRQFQDTEFESSASLSRIRSIIDFGETSNQGRLYIWKKSAEYIMYSPVFGVGIGNYPVILNEPQSASEAGASAHNVYLHIASTIGIFGLLAFLWIMFEIIKASINYLRGSDPQDAEGGQTPLSGEDNFWALYFAMMLFSLAWVGVYLMTDATLYDGRALLGFMGMIAIGVGLLQSDKYFK